LAALEDRQGQTTRAYTGDVDAAEQARDDIIAANKAIQDSYYERAYNSIAARMIEEGNFEQLADVAVSLGIMTREEADLRTQYANTIAAIDELTSSTAFYGMTAAQQAGAVKSLAAGVYDTAAAAMAAQEELKKAQERLNRPLSATTTNNWPMAQTVRTVTVSQRPLAQSSTRSVKESSTDFAPLSTNTIQRFTKQRYRPTAVLLRTISRICAPC